MMKRGTKTALTIAGLALGFGLVLHLTGFAMGGRSESEISFRNIDLGVFEIGPFGIHIGGENGIHLTNDGVDVGGEHGVHVGADGIYVGGTEQDLSSLSGTMRVIEKNDLASFSSIDVDLELGDIWLQEGEEPSVSLSWNLKNYTINCWVEEGTLKVGDQSENKKGDSGVSLFSKVIITLPAGTELEEINLYTDLGDVNVDAELTVRNVFLKTDLGDISCMALTAEWLEANTDLGDVNIAFPQLEGVSYTAETEWGEVWVDGKAHGSSYTNRVVDEQHIIYGKSSFGDVSLRIG